jgi:hypothetical protein
MRINSESTLIKDSPQEAISASSEILRIISIHKNTEGHITVYHRTSFRRPQKYWGSFLSTRIQKVNSHSATIRHFGVHRSTEDHFRPQDIYRRSYHIPPQYVISASTEILRIISVHKNTEGQFTLHYRTSFRRPQNTEDNFRPQKYGRSIHIPQQCVISASTEILRDTERSIPQPLNLARDFQLL